MGRRQRQWRAKANHSTRQFFDSGKALWKFAVCFLGHYLVGTSCSQFVLDYHRFHRMYDYCYGVSALVEFVLITCILFSSIGISN